MKCRKNRGKKCLFWLINHLFGFFCFKDNNHDRYTISCHDEQKLKNEGKKDAKNDELIEAEYDGEKYYCTKFIERLLKDFANEARNDYNDNYNGELIRCNQEISDCMNNGAEIKNNAQIRIAAKSESIKKANGNTIVISPIEADITGIYVNCTNELNKYNTNGKNKMNEVERLIDKYSSGFNAELDFYFNKIFIYWKSFCTAYKKIHGKNEQNLKLDKEILIKANNITNPTDEFQIKQFIEIDAFRSIS